MGLIAALVPAWEEEGRIAGVILGLRGRADVVVVCDDGSKDRTAEVARALGARVLRHPRNMGYGAALADLMAEARRLGADAAFTFDGDGQHDPGAVAGLLAPVLRGEADVVVGSRFLAGAGGGARHAAVRWIGRLAGARVGDSQNGMRAYSFRALGVVAPSEPGMAASTEILRRAADAGLRVVEAPAPVSYGEGAHSRGALAHGAEVALDTARRRLARHPLSAFGLPGLGLLGASAGFLWWTLALWQAKGYVVGNVALAAVACGLAGLLLELAAVLVWVLAGVMREAGLNTRAA